MPDISISLGLFDASNWVADRLLLDEQDGLDRHERGLLALQPHFLQGNIVAEGIRNRPGGTTDYQLVPKDVWTTLAFDLGEAGTLVVWFTPKEYRPVGFGSSLYRQLITGGDAPRHEDLPSWVAVRVSLKDLESAIRPKGKRGPKEQYPWGDFEVEVRRLWDHHGRSFLAGDPEFANQAQLEKLMKVWCQRTWGIEPGDTSVRDHIACLLPNLPLNDDR